MIIFRRPVIYLMFAPFNCPFKSIYFCSRWFKNVDWEEVYYKQLKPPIVPKVSYDGDTRNFDDYPETDWRQVPAVSEREFRMFEDF